MGEQELSDRVASLERAVARRRKLQSMFNDASFVDKVLRQGRYLRLCAAIAWAGEREERARAAVETDAMVDRLREAMGGQGAPARETPEPVVRKAASR